jgi:hypothetical protein
MDQKFVHHPLTRRPQAHAKAASARLAVSEYLAYLTMLSIGVVIAIITFAYAANITVHWLNSARGAGFFASEAQSVAPATGETAIAPTKFAMIAPDKN